MARVFVPGSFDPFHLGHLDVVVTAHRLFGEVVIGVLFNREKSSGLFTPDERVELIDAAVRSRHELADASVSVVASGELAVDAAAQAGADFIVKGVRTAADYEVEQQMAHTNRAVAAIDTVFVPCNPRYSFISSRFIREIAARQGDITSLVSAPIVDALSARFSNRESDGVDGES